MADADQSSNENLENSQDPEEKSPSDGEELLQRVRNLMRRVTAARSSPHPRFLHTLAAIIEEEESRSEKDVGESTSSTPRPNHVGKLVNLIRDNDDFFELLSSKLLVESRHSIAVKAGAARLLLACLSCGMYPDVFDDAVLSNIKQWVIEDAPKSTSDGVLSRKPGGSKAKGPVSTDWDMLRTYSLGLLGLALTAGGSIIEEVLATGVAGKLMHYLRVRVLKDTKDWAGSEHKSSGSSAVKIRDDIKHRARQPSEATAHIEIAQEVAEGGDKLAERETLEKSLSSYDADDDGDGFCDEKCHRRENREGKGRVMDSSFANLIGKDGTMDDAVRGEHSKRKSDARDRGSFKVKGKAKFSDGTNDSERDLSTLGGGGRRCGVSYEKTKSFKGNDAEKSATESLLVPFVEGTSACDDVSVTDVDKDAIDQYGSIIVNGVDISVAVKKAARAAETEAKNARASVEAVKAAEEAATDLVKCAALEALEQSLDKEATLAAAMSAAVSVEDAGAATKAIRKNILTSNQSKEDLDEEEADLEFSELRDCALSHEALGSLREIFSVQCLQRLGEYQEVLGPVLRERGVDVCLILLQRESAGAVFTRPKAMLPDVLKLICALAAHRKFSALFVDRGGVQLILAAPRNSQTYTEISLCLFAFASIQGVMERVCTAPTEVVNEVVSLALHVLECVQDSARKNAVFFFGASFVFRAILDAFDAQDGLGKMVNLLQNAVALRSGGNTGLPGTLPTSRADRAASAEVLTSSEKQIAYHTCVALRQYFRAHLLILVDTIRPYRGRNGLRMFPSGRAAYKPLDISNEAMESLILQIQRDRKLGPAFVRARWPMLEKFINFSGHLVLLELTQVGPGERFFHDIAQHALGVLQIVTLMPFSRKPIISSTLSNDRSSMSVLFDAANATVFSEPEVIQAALLVLVNLVCPPPSLSSRLNQQSSSSQQQIPSSEGRERHGKSDNLAEKSVVERCLQTASGLSDGREGLSKGDIEKVGALSNNYGPISPALTLVGDRRISLGSVAGGPGIAAYIEQGYRQARDAVRANNGIRVLLHLLYPRPVLPPSSLDCIRALACRVLLGLARDDAIAHILTKLQVGKLLAELLRDGGSHFGRTAAASGGGEQGRWHTELGQVSMELMALVTNAGRAGTLVTSDAAAPTLRRIERAAIAAATPINYPSRELLQLIHEHLVLAGLPNAASTLLEEAKLAPLPSLIIQGHTVSQSSTVEPSQEAIQWPTGRIVGGFMAGSLKTLNRKDEPKVRTDHVQGSSLKKTPICSLTLQRPPQSSPFPGKRPACLQVESTDFSMESNEKDEGFRICGGRLGDLDYAEASRNSFCVSKLTTKRKCLGGESTFTPNKRHATGDMECMPTTYKSSVGIKNCQSHSSSCLPNEQAQLQLAKPQVELLPNDDSDLGRPLQVPSATPNQVHTSVYSHANLHVEPQSAQSERATLDSLVVQYLKHQHRQCPAPITTLPPLSLFHPHVCPEPSRASYAPYNLTGRLAAREIAPPYGGAHGRRRNKHFIYSRFRPWRQCRDERTLLTSSTFLGTSFRLAAGSHVGEIRLFDCHSGDVVETHMCHQTPITLLQSASKAIGGAIESTEKQPGHLLLSSGSFDVRLWNSSMLGGVPLFSFDSCKAARFNNKGDVFAAISSNSQKEVLLYDVQTGQRQQKLSDPSYLVGAPRGSSQCITHFNPSDTLLLWTGVLWDHRLARSVHRFDQFTDYGGGGFHPAGNEVVINSEVWDLRTFKLLRSVPSLDQTVITFNAPGDVIYAILRRNLDDITSAIHPRRNRHPLFAAFRTMDAFDYTDIATTSVDRCVLDLAAEPTDSLISVVALDGHEEMDALVKLYEVGRRKPTEDDSDPDDGGETDDEEDSLAEEEAIEEDALHLDADDSDLDGSSNDGSGDEADEDVEVEFDTHEEDEDEAVEVDGSVVEIITDGSEGELQLSFSSEDEGSFGDFEDDDDDDFNDILEAFL